jgi:predicted DNA-binding transcriptional regulator AlpA
MNDDVILTMEEAAGILKMSPKQVYELCRARSQERMTFPFPAFSVHSKAKRIRMSDLMTWIDKMATQGRARC